MVSNASQPLPEPQIIPLELGGKWIAWSSDCLRIIANADTLKQCKVAAQSTGEEDPCYQKVPPPDVRIIGAAR